MVRNNQSIGLIETLGFVTAIHAVDAMCKAAGVTIAGYKKVGSGLVTVYVHGEVGAVQVAVESGVTAGNRVGKVISSLIIARPEKAVVDKLNELKKTKAPAAPVVAKTGGNGNVASSASAQKKSVMAKAPTAVKKSPAAKNVTAVKKAASATRLEENKATEHKPVATRPTVTIAQSIMPTDGAKPVDKPGQEPKK